MPRGKIQGTNRRKADVVPTCEKCGAPATRFNFGLGESYLCETDFETYKLSHSQIEIFAWMRLSSGRQ